MPVYFLGGMLLTVLGMKGFLALLQNTGLFGNKEAVDNNQKPCIRELHENKQNTFTMGGVVMNIVLLLLTAGFFLFRRKVLWLNLFMLLYGVMGFADDMIKSKKLRDGVKPWEKLAGLTVISSLAVVFLAETGSLRTELILPFFHRSISMSVVPYSLLMILLLVATTNSVNLTDGLDGLALGIAILAFGFIGAAAWKTGNTEVLYSAGMLLGICAGTLVYNHYPAKIFMGDTGSLFLGGAVGLLLIELNLPMWTILILIVCLWETLSVIIQLTSLKLTGKKVFRIAPYHHHLEKRGWKETRIVLLFWLITLVFCIIGYVAFRAW